MAQVNSPEVRKLAEQRKAKLQETFESIRKYAEPLKAQFDPWMLDLKDLKALKVKQVSLVLKVYRDRVDTKGKLV